MRAEGRETREDGRGKIYNRQIVLLVLAAFFALLSYPFTRTSAAPFFNAAYGSKYLSWAMIASAVLAIIVVIIYNRLAKKFRLLDLSIGITLFIIFITTFFGFIMGHHSRWLALIYYAWSDVYIIILVEQFWSITNTLFDKKYAKKYFGLFLASGSTASLVGNYIVSKLVEPLGSGNMIYFCSASLVIFVGFLWLIRSNVNSEESFKSKFTIEHSIADKSIIGGSSLVFKSRYLLLIALLVVSTQLYINGTYFILNESINSAIPVLDKQSAMYGKIFFVIQMVTMFFSFIVTPVALKFLGVTKTHFSVVITVLIIFLITLFMPTLTVVAVLFVAAKSFDYSIYRGAKEMFYLPLATAEKFQAKTFIDVFVYRFSKAIAALLIMLVGQMFDVSILFLVGFGIFAWFIIIYKLTKDYNKIGDK